MIDSAYIRMEAVGTLLVICAFAAVRFNLPVYYKGIIAGLCFMTHPVLLVCSLALAMVELRRGWKSLLKLILTASIVSIPYFMYISRDFDSFKNADGASIRPQSGIEPEKY